MKRIIVALAMVAASVFVASPALADESATDTTTSQASADQAAADQAAADQAAADQAAADKAAADKAAADAAKAADDAAAADAAKAAEDAAAADAAKAAEDAAAADAAKAAADAAAAAAAAAGDPVAPESGKVSIAVKDDNVEHVPVNICHATSSDTNPYTFITPDDDSVKFAGHLAHRDDPNKTWKNAGTFNGVAHVAGAPKPDIIGPFPAEPGNPAVTAATCNGETTDTTVQPVAPAVTQSSVCDVPGSVVLPPDLIIDEVTVIHYSFDIGSADMTSGPYDIRAEIIVDGYVFGPGDFEGDTEAHFTGTLVAAEVCQGVSNDAIADVVTSQNCDGGDVPETTTVEGVTYKFTKGDGVSGPWEITATAKDGFTLTGKTVFSGNAGNPDNCGKVNPVSDDNVVPNAGVLPDTGGSPLGLLAISGLLIVGGATLIGRRRTI